MSRPDPRPSSRPVGSRRARRLRILAPAAAALLVAACGPRTVTLELQDVELARGPGSGEPHLFAADDGTAQLTWLEPDGGSGWALRLAIRDASGWSEPRTIRTGTDFFVNWADFPSSTRMADGTIVAHWLQRVAEAPYAYHVMLATSGDGGESWSAPFRVHDDETPTEHGFVSMVPWEGGAAITWLDGRAMWTPPAGGSGAGDGSAGPAGSAGGSPNGGHGGGDGGAMSVRFRTLASDGTLGPEVVLDARTCECCQTALARGPDGLIAAYRDRSDEEIRDIALVRGAGETWSEPAHVSADGWEIPGCPVNGPQLSARGASLVTAWYTGVGDAPQVYVAFSEDGGATFGERIRVDEGTPLGRVDIERLDDGSAIVVWLEAGDGGARVLARRVTPEGMADPVFVISETSGERASGFPRLARIGDELVLAWTLPGDAGGVRVRGIRVDD